MKKDVDIAKNLRLIRSYGINTWVNYMLTTPGSSLQDDLNSLKMNREGNVTYPHYTNTDPMVGTALYDYCVDNNFISDSYKGDMNMCFRRSSLNNFSEREKTIRYNVYCFGSFINILPFPIDRIFGEMIKYIPDTRFNLSFFNFLHAFYQTKKIFKIKKERFSLNQKVYKR